MIGEIKKYETVNPHLILDLGEKMCMECNGWGYLSLEKTNAVNKGWTTTDHKLCPRCLGKCTLEFIDAVVGYNRDKRWA